MGGAQGGHHRTQVEGLLCTTFPPFRGLTRPVTIRKRLHVRAGRTGLAGQREGWGSCVRASCSNAPLLGSERKKHGALCGMIQSNFGAGNVSKGSCALQHPTAGGIAVQSLVSAMRRLVPLRPSKGRPSPGQTKHSFASCTISAGSASNKEPKFSLVGFYQTALGRGRSQQ